MVERLVHLDIAQPCAQLLVLAGHLLVLVARRMTVVLLKLPGVAERQPVSSVGQASKVLTLTWRVAARTFPSGGGVGG